MKEVLCYGDSNTWGYNPVTKDRYEKDERWTGVFQNTLGNDYHAIEEGLRENYGLGRPYRRVQEWKNPSNTLPRNPQTS